MTRRLKRRDVWLSQKRACSFATDTVKRNKQPKKGKSRSADSLRSTGSGGTTFFPSFSLLSHNLSSFVLLTGARVATCSFKATPVNNRQVASITRHTSTSTMSARKDDN